MNENTNLTINGNVTINQVNQGSPAQDQPEVQQAERHPIDRTGEVLISNETTFKELLGILKARPEVAVAALDEEKEKLRAEREKRLRKIYGEDFDKLISEEDKELLKKAKRRPGAVQLRTYEPRVAKIEIGADGTCEVYSNGYAVYDNGDRKTVIWVPGCGRAMYYFTELKESEKNCWTETDENGETHDVRMMGSAVIEDDVLWQLPWYHAVVIAGENQIELNLGRPKSKGTESEKKKRKKRRSGKRKPTIAGTAAHTSKALRKLILRRKQRRNGLICSMEGYVRSTCSTMKKDTISAR